MSSPVAAGDVLPALPTIKTRAATVDAPAPASSSAAPSKAPDAEPLPAAVEEEAEPKTTTTAAVEEAEPRTPTSEESKLRTPTECPPAPRKSAWTTSAKRRSSSALSPSSSSSSPRPAVKRRLYFDVPRDLSAVFRSLPPKKRIHAG